MRLTFLGTSSGTPTVERNVTGIALRLDNGRVWLFDCGEGSQQQMLRTDLRPARIDRIFLTHLHGDHCFGLPGLLASAAVHGRVGASVEVFGPVGVRELLETTLRLSHTHLPFPLVIQEISEGCDLPARDGIGVRARPLTHRVPCFGYSLREDPFPGRFDPQKARARGVAEGPLFGRLQRGESVTGAGGRVVHPSEVMDLPRRGRHVVLLGDTRDSREMLEEARRCDVLTHEVTYDATRESDAIRWGHSTSSMAGRFAQEVGARVLLVTHFSPRYMKGSTLTVQDLVEQARKECPETRVIAAADRWHFEIERPAPIRAPGE